MEETAKYSILIVDDEKPNLNVLGHTLRHEYTVYTARDGNTALEIAGEYSPDLILLDIVMPDMDGYEVIAALKQSDRTRSIPVIFITGLHEARDEEKGLLLGAVDYISKPFNAAIVKLRIQNQITMHNYIRTIERLSLTDQLTDLPNRRSFDDRIRLEWKRAMREKKPISVLVIDIDNFKKHNDTYGHLQGDVTLQIIGRIFGEELRRSVDFGARWGGEEFIALLVNTESDGALEVAERIRKRIDVTPIPLVNGQSTQVAVSIGIHTQTPLPENSVDDFIRKADDALYIAKRRGRNRVCRMVDNQVY